jgi:hypothetical protein
MAPGFSWEWIQTKHFNNITDENIVYYMNQSIVIGVGAELVYWVPGRWLKGLAAGVVNEFRGAIPEQQISGTRKEDIKMKINIILM